MASCLFASPTSRLSSAQRGAECRLPVFHTETQRNYQGNSLGVTLQKLPLCLSSFTLSVRWLYLLTLVTYRSKNLGVSRLAAFLQCEIHRALTGKDCNPQPANCLKDQYVLRHCCVDDRSGKIGSFRKSSCFNKIQHGNNRIIPLLTLL